MDRGTSALKWIVGAGLVVVILAFVLIVLGQHFYFLSRVNQQEVGVRFRGGRIYEIVGPGVYSDVALYAELKKVSSEAVPFSVEDPEVITLDRQRVGLRVSGDVFRPNYGESETLRELWPSYQGLYLSDEALRNRVSDLALQAMKACVGDRKFDDNVTEASRDELGVCMDTNLNGLASKLGLNVRSVTVSVF